MSGANAAPRSVSKRDAASPPPDDARGNRKRIRARFELSVLLHRVRASASTKRIPRGSRGFGHARAEQRDGTVARVREGRAALHGMKRGANGSPAEVVCGVQAQRRTPGEVGARTLAPSRRGTARRRSARGENRRTSRNGRARRTWAWPEERSRQISTWRERPRDRSGGLGLAPRTGPTWTPNGHLRPIPCTATGGLKVSPARTNEGDSHEGSIVRTAG